MISSAGNSRVKQIVQLNTKAKFRRSLRLFAAEGVKMFQEAPAEWIKEVYISESLYGEGDWQSRLGQFHYETVSDSVFQKMSDTRTPQGILTVLRQPAYRWKDLTACRNPLLLILEGLQDPGNLGTLLRTAEGAGADGVILCGDCADIFNPKVIRATMGSIYRMPFLQTDDPARLMERLKRDGIRTYAAHLSGENTYDAADYSGGSAFLIGNEANGLSREMTALADCLIRIPMQGRVESLNAAMAGGILLYEAARQRRNS